MKVKDLLIIYHKILVKNLHLVSLLVSLIMIFIFFKPILSPILDSRLNFFYGDFSLIIGSNSGLDKYKMIYYIFSERWGAPELHIVRRFLLEGNIAALANLIPITDSQITSIAILISIILGCYGIFKLITMFERRNSFRALLVLTLTLFYYLNLWSAERLIHIWLWTAYAIFPLFIYFGLAYILNRKLKHLIIYSLLFAIYGIIPHNFIQMFIIHIFLVISLIILFKNVKTVFYFISGPLFIYLLANIPFLLVWLKTSGLEYPIPMSIDQLSLISRNGKLINIFTFSNNWWPKVPAYLLEDQLFRITSLLLFFFTFLMVSVAVATPERWNKLFVLLSSIFVLGLVFFIQGTNNFILSTIIQIFCRLGYVDIFAPFREWGKFSLLLPIFFVIILIFGITSLKSRKKVILTFLLLFLVTINVISSPSLIYLNEVYLPTYVPSEYYDLGIKIDVNHKVIWVYPISAQNILGTWRYAWNDKKAVAQYLERSIGSSHNINSEYVKMLTQKEAPRQLLDILNIKHIIKRTDILGASKFRVDYEYLNCSRLNYLTICENPNNLSLFYVPNSLILSDQDGKNFYAITFTNFPFKIAMINEFRNDVIETSQTVLIDFVSNWLYEKMKNYGTVVTPFKFTCFVNPSKLWSKASTSDPLHGEWHPYLERFNIENWQSDYGKGLVFTWAPNKLANKVNPTEKDLINFWSFESERDVEEWKNYTKENQFNAIHKVIWDENEKAMRVELWNSTWGWKTINSPLIPVKYGNFYRVEFKIKLENGEAVHLKLVEYDNKGKILNSKQILSIGSGTTGWKNATFDFMIEDTDTTNIQLQIWHGHETKQGLPNIIWLKDFKIYDLKDFIEPNSLEIPFKIEKNDEYVLLVRYFKNQEGGKIKIDIDNKSYIINTKDQLNKFVWERLDTLNLKRGKYNITLSNLVGFNAVNLFALVPSNEYERILKEIENTMKDKRILYIFEGESDLYRENVEIKKDKDASNGELLEILPNGYVRKDFEILKEGFYKFVFRAKGGFIVKIGNRTFDIYSEDLGFVYLDPIYLEKGKHEIELIPKLIVDNLIWSFESESDVEEWKNYTKENQFNAIHKVIWDENEKAMRVELWNSTWGWKTINSPLIPVKYGEKYNIAFDIMAQNGESVHCKVVELDSKKKSIGSYYISSIGSGNFSWKRIDFYYEPKNVSSSYIQLQIWHGHQTNKSLPNIIWVKNSSFSTNKRLLLDNIFIYSVDNSTSEERLEDLFASEETPAEVLNYSKINPTLWKVQVNASKPFMLSFAESYDPLWEARVYKDGKKVEVAKSIQLYGVINGFWINTTGENLEIVIRYTPQDWFEMGLVISGITFAFCIFYLIYDWRKGKGDIWTKRLERSINEKMRNLKLLRKMHNF